jgi:predicted acetyltransferase
MLYKFKGFAEKPNKLEPMAFLSLYELDKVEKDLENIIAENLLDLFEESPLMPIFQERQYQKEADIYALNKNGDLIIFELKRREVGIDAMHQIFRYAQDAGQWQFRKLEEVFQTYNSDKNIYESKSLQQAHKEAFELEDPLAPEQFNRKQQLIVIGSAPDVKLIDSVEYWQTQGLNVEFIPYRVFKISGEYYFEFFSKPNDEHKNPSDIKGVLFDTNRSYDEESIWDMLSKKRISAYGDRSYEVEYLYLKDIVFYSHRGWGIVAGAEVISSTKSDGPGEKYHDVKFLTPIPNKDAGIQNYIPFNKVAEITGKSFFWARTRKVPYLTREEALLLVEELNKILSR